MTTKAFYKLSLALPILIPLPFLTALHSTDPNPFAFILATSLWIGGILYVLLAIGLVIWMRNKTTNDIRYMLLRSPILMILALLICDIVWAVSTSNAPSGNSSVFDMWFLSSVFAVPLGYAYVGFVSFVLWTMKNLHLAHDQD